MQALQTFNEYENGKTKKSEFKQVLNPLAKFEEQTRKITCEKHGEVTATVFLNPFSGEEMPCACPLCAEEQAEAEEKAEREREEKRAKAEREARYEKSNVAPEYWEKTLDDYKPITAKQKEFLAAIRKLLEEKQGKIFVLGVNGIGKTMLGSIAVKEMGGAIYTMHEITRDERDCMKAGMSEKDFEYSLINLPLLVIDEIGRSKGSEFELNLLSYILDKRHTRNLPFIILSNTHFARDCPHGKEGCDKCFERFFDNDLLSRFRQDGKFIVLEKDAPDWRNPKNKGIFEK